MDTGDYSFKGTEDFNSFVGALRNAGIEGSDICERQPFKKAGKLSGRKVKPGAHMFTTKPGRKLSKQEVNGFINAAIKYTETHAVDPKQLSKLKAGIKTYQRRFQKKTKLTGFIAKIRAFFSSSFKTRQSVGAKLDTLASKVDAWITKDKESIITVIGQWLTEGNSTADSFNARPINSDLASRFSREASTDYYSPFVQGVVEKYLGTAESWDKKTGGATGRAEVRAEYEAQVAREREEADAAKAEARAARAAKRDAIRDKYGIQKKGTSGAASPETRAADRQRRAERRDAMRRKHGLGGRRARVISSGRTTSTRGLDATAAEFRKRAGQKKSLFQKLFG